MCAWERLTPLGRYEDLLRVAAADGLVYWWQVYTARSHPGNSPLSRWHLPDGLHAGSSEAAVRRRDRNLRTVAEPGQNNVGLETTGAVARFHDADAGIGFVLHDGRVYEIVNDC